MQVFIAAMLLPNLIMLILTYIYLNSSPEFCDDASNHDGMIPDMQLISKTDW